MTSASNTKRNMVDVEGSGDNSSSSGRLCEWVEFPLLVQENIFRYLDHKTVNRMRETCRETQYIIDREYGNHTKLPAQNRLNVRRTIGSPYTAQHISDARIEAAVLAMEGKVIRSLEMLETPAHPGPFQFERFIQRPMRLRYLHLRYLDIRLIHKFLRSCRHLSTLQYETGYNLYAGKVGSLLPHQIPVRDEQLIGILQELPALAQLARLTSLTLSMKDMVPATQSDWANPLHLLLVIPSSAINLKRISFSIESLDYLFEFRLQILAIFGEFLARSPSLQHVEFISEFNQSVRGDGELAQNIFTALINQYGSDLLKFMLATLESDDRMMLDEAREILYQIIRRAAGNLRKLETFTLKLSIWNLESIAFKSFIWGLASLRHLLLDDIDHSLEREQNDLYFLLLGLDPADDEEEERWVSRPIANMEGLHIKRTFDVDPVANRTVLLGQFLERMRKLKHLKVEGKHPRCHSLVRQYSERDEPNEDGNVLLNVVQRFQEQPEFTIGPTLDQSMCQNMETLELSNVSMLTRDVARLKTWRSLNVLYLNLNVGYWHSYFGINSGDLIELILSLRKLDRLFLSPVYFPPEEEDNDDTLAGAHRTALTQLGRLTRIQGRQYNPTYWSFEFGE